MTMNEKTQNYSLVLSEFNRHTDTIFQEHVPDHAKSARKIIDRKLKEKYPKLKRWYMLLLKGLLTADEFLKLITDVKWLFTGKDLKATGISKEKADVVSGILSKLFRAMLLHMSGAAANNNFNEYVPLNKL
jgi:hypothetical protein